MDAKASDGGRLNNDEVFAVDHVPVEHELSESLVGFEQGLTQPVKPRLASDIRMVKDREGHG